MPSAQRQPTSTASVRSTAQSSHTARSEQHTTPVIQATTSQVSATEPSNRRGAVGLNRNLSITAASLRKRPSIRPTKENEKSIIKTRRLNALNDSNVSVASTFSSAPIDTGRTWTLRLGKRKVADLTIEQMNATNGSSTGESSVSILSVEDENDQSTATNAGGRKLRPRHNERNRQDKS